MQVFIERCSADTESRINFKNVVYVCVATITFVNDVVENDHVEGLQLSRQAHRIGASELHSTGLMPFLLYTHTPPHHTDRYSTQALPV